MAAHGQTQQAQNVTVTRNVRRYGSYPGGYQIINTSLYSTVWASDNPSMQSGQGTPISPGTSINWTGDGDIFLIVGDDATSLNPLLGNSIAAVVLTYDVQNWQPNPVAVAAAVLNSGIIIVDNPLQMVNSVLAGTTAAFDVSRYNSLQCIFVPFAAGGPSSITIQWSDTASFAGILFQDTISWGVTGSIYLEEWHGTVPCRSSFFRLVYAGTPNTITGRVIASYRQVNTIRQTLPSSAFAHIGGFSVNVPGLGNSGSLRVAPWFGLVDVHFLNIQNNGYLDIANLGNQDNADTVEFSGIAAVVNSGAYTAGGLTWNRFTLALNGTQLRVTLVNLAAAANDMRAFFYPHRDTI